MGKGITLMKQTTQDKFRFVAIIKSKMQEMQLSSAALSKATGVNQPDISRYLNKVFEIKSYTVDKLPEYLRIDRAAVFDEEDAPPAPSTDNRSDWTMAELIRSFNAQLDDQRKYAASLEKTIDRVMDEQGKIRDLLVAQSTLAPELYNKLVGAVTAANESINGIRSDMNTAAQTGDVKALAHFSRDRMIAPTWTRATIDGCTIFRPVHWPRSRFTDQPQVELLDDIDEFAPPPFN